MLHPRPRHRPAWWFRGRTTTSLPQEAVYHFLLSRMGEHLEARGLTRLHALAGQWGPGSCRDAVFLQAAARARWPCVHWTTRRRSAAVRGQPPDRSPRQGPPHVSASDSGEPDGRRDPPRRQCATDGPHGVPPQDGARPGGILRPGRVPASTAAPSGDRGGRSLGTHAYTLEPVPRRSAVGQPWFGRQSSESGSTRAWSSSSERLA